MEDKKDHKIKYKNTMNYYLCREIKFTKHFAYLESISWKVYNSPIIFIIYILSKETNIEKLRKLTN